MPASLPRNLGGTRIPGLALLVGGLALFVSALWSAGRPGDRLAIALVLVLVALPLLYPTMLRENGAVSTMRAIVYLIVGLFSVLTIRAGWSATTLVDLKIDPWWAAIVSAAIGGKAVQSLGESQASAGSDRPATPPPLPPKTSGPSSP